MALDKHEPSTSGRVAANVAISDLDKTNPSTGDGTIFYQSGNIAVIVCKQSGGQIITFFSDSKSSEILASFNAQGVGFVYYPTGKPCCDSINLCAASILRSIGPRPRALVLGICTPIPRRAAQHFPFQSLAYFTHYPCRLVVTEAGYTLSDKKGNVVDRGKFPRTSNEAITPLPLRDEEPPPFLLRPRSTSENHSPYVSLTLRLEASANLTIRFTNRQNIVAAFRAADCVREWQCGESPRRAEGPYTAKVVSSQPGGKLELDVAAIRQRQQTLGSVYVSPGPHAVETERPGVGSLKKALRRMDPSCALASTVTDLRNLDARLGQIDTLGLSSTSTSSVSGLGGSGRVLYGTARSASAGALAGGGGAGAGGGGAGGGSLAGGSSCGRLEDYGSPELSKTQQRFANALRPVEFKYKARRMKLPYMRLRDLESQVLGQTAPSDTLIVLCVLADWNPVCARVEAQIEAAHGQFVEEGAARSGSESARIKIYKVDASEGNTLQDKYGFRTVPMFLMFFEGKLVFASNNVRTASEARDAALAALTRGRKQQFLSESFRFNPGADNTLLEYIRPTTVLREL
ncbi:hypothetical protein VOLCADRAFT_91846 [Volvox carteri f. nagariensis]|uniref:FAM194 C-terminal domain-containing protein n=1 Tax=Volvox carteri f. nagariensis TaxID=3068 RepID=D8TY40_VOLCA|nr:uncharacterized protein VOLCADRAFT_91846 [Volvox carteri f. nagariensis]EFJ47483.1 hypothetical protein VOLCADRAFT_91846 [Volvox carteri f. nagariensis]|eukprot:XP_002951307.1 hypothetical protein VOLCADRAFT_91846 [Volvox carteri f. nagariensis]